MWIQPKMNTIILPSSVANPFSKEPVSEVEGSRSQSTKDKEAKNRVERAHNNEYPNGEEIR